jgi:hypothetical protein
MTLLVGEPRHRLTGDARDDGARGRQLDAVRLVHPATREANELLDLVATDRPHHRVDNLTRRRRHHPSVALSDRGKSRILTNATKLMGSGAGGNDDLDTTPVRHRSSP